MGEGRGEEVNTVTIDLVGAMRSAAKKLVREEVVKVFVVMLDVVGVVLVARSSANLAEREPKAAATGLNKIRSGGGIGQLVIVGTGVGIGLPVLTIGVASDAIVMAPSESKSSPQCWLLTSAAEIATIPARSKKESNVLTSELVSELASGS